MNVFDLGMQGTDYELCARLLDSPPNWYVARTFEYGFGFWYIIESHLDGTWDVLFPFVPPGGFWHFPGSLNVEPDH